MGFRNPVRFAVDPTARDLANQALTQIIPGSRLAADAIDGKTITGAKFRTAAAGQRIQIDSTDFNRVKFFTGDSAEKVTGYLEVGVVLATLGAGVGAGGDRPRVRWQVPQLTTALPASNATLDAWGTTRNGSAPGYWEFGGDVYIGGRLVNDMLGVVAATYTTATLSTATNAETRLTGGHNITNVTLSAGRMYEAVWTGNLNAAGAAGRVAVSIRAALGGVVPTVASPLASIAMQYLSVTGGGGQGTATTAGQPFQVAATRTYAFHLFGAHSVTGGSMSAVPLSGGQGITIFDRGPAEVGLPVLL